MVTVKNQYKKNRRRAILRLLLLIAIVVLVNILFSGFFWRIDLTQEKRFSLSAPTKELLKQQTDIIYVKIYLAGNLTPNMKRLQQSTIELMDEFKNYAHDNIGFEVIDPFAIKDQDNQNKYIKDLESQGVFSVQFMSTETDQSSLKYLFPFATLEYKGRELSIPLIDRTTRIPLTPDSDPSVSISLLEYNFAKAIRELTDMHKPEIGFISGEGELDTLHVKDIAGSLSELYHVSLIDLPNSFGIDTTFKTIIIAKPTTAFKEQDKYKIDQYLMHGGNILWLIDPVIADFDSLRYTGQFMAVDYDLNIEDQLLQYGVRVNTNIIEDKQCTHINVPYGNSFMERPWPYSPVLTNFNKTNPISKNVDAIEGKFVSTVDTIRAPGIKKTILLSTSQNSRYLMSPVNVNYNVVDDRYAPTVEQYNKPDLPVAVLLEGNFPSAFRSIKPTAEALAKLQFGNGDYVEQGVPAKQIVIGDGDMIKNNVDPKTGEPDILGVNYIEKYIYGNKDFLLNCVEYLNDKTGLIDTRAKEVKMRPLDEKRVADFRVQWQLINIAAPLLLLYIFSGIYIFIRSRKYTSAS